MCSARPEPVVLRTYPALDVTWLARPDGPAVERLLAEIDSDHPTALDDRPDGLRIFFASADDRRRAALRLTGLDGSVTCLPVDVPDEDWAERSQADLPSVRVGQLTIDPRGLSPGAADVIVIHPSMGFGTGHHASTRRCLALLQTLRLSGRRVLDVGTGSGVLAIAAVRLGAIAAVALDHDPDALVAAAESVELNGVTRSVTLRTADLAADPALTEEPFDVVLANLTGALLIRQARTLARLVAPGGALIVSGFMTDEAPSVAEAFVAHGLSAGAVSEEDGWTGWVFSRPSGG